MDISQPRLLDGGKELEIGIGGRKRRFHALWLRDNAQDAGTRSASNGQRLITILDIPAATRIAEAQLCGGRLAVRFEPEGKSVSYGADWLASHAYDAMPPQPKGWTGAEIERWDSGLQAHVPTASYGDVTASRAALGKWLAAVRRHGFAVMTELPTASGTLCKVAELFGYVRETNYGRWFEVRAEVNPNNLAYTNLGLQAHTDNPYRDPVPTLQILACLENTVEGGDSIVVDGFKVAERLQTESPHGFDLLAKHCARFEYAGCQGHQAPLQAAGHRTRSRRGIDRHPLQQPLGGRLHRHSL